MNEKTARLLLGVGLPALALGLVLVPYVAVRSDLPDRLATHFDGSGVPDGSMTPTGFLFFTLIMVFVGLVPCIWLARTHRRLIASAAPLVGFLGGFLAGLGSGIAVVTLLGQRSIETWQEASGLWVLVVVPLVLALGAGALAARAASTLPTTTPSLPAAMSPKMELGAQQQAVWAETLHSKWIGRAGVAAILLGIVAAIGTVWWFMVPAVIVGFVMLSLATLQVRADRTGLHVKYGLLPWPRTHLAVDQIDTAQVIDVRPMQWGGWGYRGSLKLMNQAAVVHRAGPGIRLDLNNGKVFVVTVDHPENAVALLNAEVARSAV